MSKAQRARDDKTGNKHQIRGWCKKNLYNGTQSFSFQPNSVQPNPHMKDCEFGQSVWPDPTSTQLENQTRILGYQYLRKKKSS